MSHSQVTIFPQDPTHRLVYADLAAFLDRFTERVIALGAGANAEVFAGEYRMRAYTYLELVAAIDEARVQCAGRHDLDIRLWGDVHDGYARFVGSRTGEARFQAFVQPAAVGTTLCGGCGQPLDGAGAAQSCANGCDAPRSAEELSACWWLTLTGEGTNGLGERFHREARRFAGSPYLTTLQGTARTPLHEWHS